MVKSSLRPTLALILIIILLSVMLLIALMGSTAAQEACFVATSYAEMYTFQSQFIYQIWFNIYLSTLRSTEHAIKMNACRGNQGKIRFPIVSFNAVEHPLNKLVPIVTYITAALNCSSPTSLFFLTSVNL